jgi:hypothetical protein
MAAPGDGAPPPFEFGGNGRLLDNFRAALPPWLAERVTPLEIMCYLRAAGIAFAGIGDSTLTVKIGETQFVKYVIVPDSYTPSARPGDFGSVVQRHAVLAETGGGLGVEITMRQSVIGDPP